MISASIEPTQPLHYRSLSYNRCGVRRKSARKPLISKGSLLVTRKEWRGDNFHLIRVSLDLRSLFLIPLGVY